MCVVGSKSFFVPIHTQFILGLFTKIKLNWVFCFLGVLSLFSLVLYSVNWFNFLIANNS